MPIVDDIHESYEIVKELKNATKELGLTQKTTVMTNLVIDVTMTLNNNNKVEITNT